jgi:transcriptional regulator with XRE-family HTH domain
MKMARERTRRPTKDTTEDYSPALGKTIQRLRKAYNMSLGELSEQSGVAKSIISQIERNETNPTIGTIWRLSRALDTSLGEVLKNDDSPNFIEVAGRNAIPVLTSQDGLCTLHIIGWLNVVEAIQWYDFHAKPGGVLESEPHQPGSVEHLSVLEGTLEVTVGGDVKVARQGETLRYRGDRDHKIVNIGDVDAHATMILMMKVPMAE